MNRTLYDLFSHVLDTEDATDDPVNRRRALRSAAWGANQAQSRHRWSGYNTTETITLNAPITTTGTLSASGVITIDLAKDDLPEWTDMSSVIIRGILYRIYRRINARSLQIDDFRDGQANASTGFTIVDDRHALTDTVREIYSIRDEDSDVNLLHVGAMQYRTLLNHQDGQPNSVFAATSVRTNRPDGRTTELRFVPAPATKTTISVSYHRNPRVARIVHDCCSVAITNGTATIDSGLPTTILNGGILLVSEDAERPDGEYAFGVVDANVTEHTLRIKSVTNKTTIVLEDASITGIEDRGGIITEELDFPPFAYNAAQRYAEAEFRRVGRGEAGEYWQTIQMADRELRLAMEQEATLRREHPVALSRSGTVHYPENLAGSDTP